MRRWRAGQGENRGPVGYLVMQPAAPALLVMPRPLLEGRDVTIPGHAPIMPARGRHGPAWERRLGTLGPALARYCLRTLGAALAAARAALAFPGHASLLDCSLAGVSRPGVPGTVASMR